jgi:hypothetical protein
MGRRRDVDDARDGDLTAREKALREDLSKEYYALVDVISGFDGRQISIKGWSVTLSLAGLGLGFQQKHYALFALASLTAFAFLFLDVMNKRHQMSYYSRMRDIEVASYYLNSVELPDLGRVSAPRIDMSWSYRGIEDAKHHDWRTDPPERRSANDIRRKYFLVWRMWNVLLPHVVAIALGAALFFVALADVSWLDSLEP